MMNYGTELQPSGGVRKLVQVSEEVQKPIHVPVVLGNECFVITQQDCRKIEDVRVISYHRVGPNGELIPIEASLGQDIALRDAIMSAAAFHAQNQIQTGINAQQLREYIGRCVGAAADRTKASIAQQMEWTASNCTSPAYPLTYAKSTLADMAQNQRTEPCHCCKTVYVTNQGCNTIEEEPSTENVPVSAKEKQKIRKMTEDLINV